MKKKFRGFICLILALITLLSVFPVIVYADDDDNDSNISFYDVASAAASYYDLSLSQGSYKKKFGLININNKLTYRETSALEAGDAGGMLGYLDSDKNSFAGWVMSAFSQSEVVYSYSSFYASSASEGSESGDSYAAMGIDLTPQREYAYYGWALNQLGLDKTASNSLDFAKIGRFITGVPMQIAYYLTKSITGIFYFVLKVLNSLNPFRWFASSGILGDLANYLPDGYGVGNAFRGIQDTVSDMYDQLYELGFTVTLPLFFAGLVVSLLLLKKAGDSSASKIKRFLIRAGFIVLGIPLLGTLYTGMLQTGLEATDTKSFDCDYIIASTFIDFENWAKEGQLQLPANAQIVVNDNGKDAAPTLNSDTQTPRVLARRINAAYSHISVTTSEDDKTFNDVATDVVDEDVSGNDRVADLLKRYMKGTLYSASDFETGFKADVSSAGKLDDVGDSIAELQDIANYDGKKAMFTGESTGAYDILKNGSLAVKAETSSDGKSTVYTYTRGTADSSGGVGGGLSSLSMYNYLNTDFDDSSFTVYSSAKATSGNSRLAHRSVNLIGTGAMSIVYYLNSLTILYAMCIIGIGYAFAIAFGTVKKGIRMIISLPLAMFGNIKAISRIVSVVAVMMVNIFVTLSMYEIVQHLLLAIMQLFETELTADVLAVGGSKAMIAAFTDPVAALSGVSVLSFIVAIVQLVFVIFFTIMAMKLRKKIVRACDDALGSMIDKVFGENAYAPERSGGPNVVQKAAGAVASGAGMAAGAALMNKAMPGMSNTQAVSGAEKGVEAGESAGAGEAQNAAGSKSEVKDGNAIQGGDRQQINNGGSRLSVEGGAGDGSAEAEGKKLLEANADSLGDTKDVQTSNDAKSDEAQSEMEKMHRADDAHSEAAKDTAKGAAKTVKGGVEAGVGAYTGNAELTKKGAEDAAAGAKDAKDGVQKGVHAEQDANESVEAERKTKDVQSQQSEQTSKVSADNEDSVKNANESQQKSLETDTENSKSNKSDVSDSKQLDKNLSESSAKAETSVKQKSSVEGTQAIKTASKAGAVQQGTASKQKKAQGSSQAKPSGTKTNTSKGAKANTKSSDAKKSSAQTKSQPKPTSAKTDKPVQSKTQQIAKKVLSKGVQDKAVAAKQKYDNMHPVDKKVLKGAAVVGTGVAASAVEAHAEKKNSKRDDDFI